MRSFGVVVFPPLFDQDLSLEQAVEDVHAESTLSGTDLDAFCDVQVPVIVCISPFTVTKDAMLQISSRSDRPHLVLHRVPSRLEGKVF